MIYVYHLVANKENQKFIQSQSKNQHKSNVTYHAECTCGETYNEETKRNFAVRKAEHENKSHNSDRARHLAKHPTCAYTLHAPRKLLFGGQSWKACKLIARNQP